MKNPNEPRTPSEAQINANRENAKKSTGPRTAEGKAASSRNRLLHGLRANKHILLDEDPAEFLSLVQNLFETFRPVGDAEETLVLRIAAAQWRLGRIFPMEAGIFRDRFHDVDKKEEFRQDQYQTKKGYAEDDGKPLPPPPTPPDEGDLLARAFNVDCEGPNSFTKLARYETSIERTIDRCLRQLKTYQTARLASASDPAGQPSPPSDPPPNAETQAASPAEPAATPPESANCHLNPKNGGIAKLGLISSAAILLAVLFLLRVPVGQTIGLCRLPSASLPVGQTIGLCRLPSASLPVGQTIGLCRLPSASLPVGQTIGLCRLPSASLPVGQTIGLCRLPSASLPVGQTIGLCRLPSASLPVGQTIGLCRLPSAQSETGVYLSRTSALKIPRPDVTNRPSTVAK